jgi:nucleotide-binding universal stress UspA family protein
MTGNILVPIDFTPVTEGALKQSILLSKQLGSQQITLLHMCKSSKDVKNAEEKLKKLADIYKGEADIQVKAAEGGIDEIGKMAELLDAGLICMGTHGLKGIQYLVGSKAIKVVSGTTLPFIITQQHQPKNEEWKEIIVPIDFASEEKRVLSAATALAKSLHGRLHLIGAGHDDQLLAKKVDLNLSFARRFLSERNVACVIKKCPSNVDFQESILDYAVKNEADLIAIVNHHEDGVRNLLGQNFDQNIITNKIMLPVLMFTGKSLSDKRDIFGMFR